MQHNQQDLAMTVEQREVAVSDELGKLWSPLEY
jgi:hypothetical protein